MPQNIKLIQINVGGGGPTMEAALQAADEEEAEVILIQDPLWTKDGLTKTYPNYRVFKPPSFKKPGVITFVRKPTQAYISTIRSCDGILDIFVPKHNIHVVNIYRRPGRGRLYPTHREIIGITPKA